MPSDNEMTVSGGFLQGRFKLHHIHFHWKYTDTLKYCTEHIIGDKKTHLEAHFVHFNTKYSSLDSALENRDGVAILVFLFKRSKTAQISSLDPIVRKFSKIVEKNTKITFEKGFPIISLIPISKSQYFTYYGCKQLSADKTNVITWIVFYELLKITTNDVSFPFWVLFTYIFLTTPVESVQTIAQL